MLRTDGTLCGPQVGTAVRLAKGDRVRCVGSGLIDGDGLELPPMEVPGRVVAVEPGVPAATVDFPIWGRHRLVGGELGLLVYDYAEVAR